MAEEKKDNQIPSFATYEKRKVLRKAKALRGWVLHKKSGEAVTDKAVSKEQGTLKTVWGVFKEALATIKPVSQFWAVCSRMCRVCCSVRLRVLLAAVFRGR